MSFYTLSQRCMPCLRDLTVFASSDRANIEEPAFYIAITLLLTVSRGILPHSQIFTGISVSKYLKTSLLEVMISSKNERVFIHNLSDLTFQIIFDGGRASINVGLKHPIAWNHSTHVPSWWFYLHCGIEKTGSPEIICIVCHEVLRHPSAHGTSTMGTHFLASAYISKLTELIESEVTRLTSSIVDTTALAIQKRQESRQITIVSSQRKFGFHIQVWTILTELPDQMLQTGSSGLWNFQILPRHVKSLSEVRKYFGSWSVEWDSTSRATTVINAIRSDFVLPSATTLSNICRSEYSLTMDSTKRQFLSPNEVCSALDG